VRGEQDLIAALRALADADGAVEASPELEIRVRKAFRARRARRRWNRVAAWTLAAAAVVIAMVTLRPPRSRPVKVAREAPPAAVLVENAAPVASSPAAKTRHARKPQPREIATGFFPLIDAPPPMDRGEVFRVTVPAAAMRTVGLPVAEDRLSDRVQADVLVSEDGLATAIRFVRNE
jgi:hypothetical protein